MDAADDMTVATFCSNGPSVPVRVHVYDRQYTTVGVGADEQ